MNCKEEQKMELEALKSVYMEEYTEKPSGKWRFSLLVLEDGEEGKKISCVLFVSYPSNYPESEPPVFDIRSFQGVYENKKDLIMNELKQLCEENLGEQVIFMLIDRLKELLVDNQIRFTSLTKSSEGKESSKDSEDESDDERELDEEELEAEEKRREEELNAQMEKEMEELEIKRKKGTPFSVEEFKKWKEVFEAERISKFGSSTASASSVTKHLAQQSSSTPSSSSATPQINRMTGRQLFESGVLNATDEPDIE